MRQTSASASPALATIQIRFPSPAGQARSRKTGYPAGFFLRVTSLLGRSARWRFLPLIRSCSSAYRRGIKRIWSLYPSSSCSGVKQDSNSGSWSPRRCSQCLAFEGLNAEQVRSSQWRSWSLSSRFSCNMTAKLIPEAATG